MWNTQLFQTYTGWKVNDNKKKYDFKLHSEHCLLFDWICSFSLSLSLSFVSHPAWVPSSLWEYSTVCAAFIFSGTTSLAQSSELEVFIHLSPEAFKLNDCSFCRLKWLFSHYRYLTFGKFIFKLRTKTNSSDAVIRLWNQIHRKSLLRWTNFDALHTVIKTNLS